MAKHVQLVLDGLKSTTGSRKVNLVYKPNKMFDHRISAEQREKTKTMFQTAQEELGGTIFDVNACSHDLLEFAAPFLGELHFDIDKSTAAMIQAVDDSGIRFGKDKFMETVF